MRDMGLAAAVRGRASSTSRPRVSIQQREDVLFLGPPGTGKSHSRPSARPRGDRAGYRVIYREAHTLLEEIADASLDSTRKDLLKDLAIVPLQITATAADLGISRPTLYELMEKLGLKE
jgi:DNA replication protein DnaC